MRKFGKEKHLKHYISQHSHGMNINTAAEDISTHKFPKHMFFHLNKNRDKK